MSNKKKKKIGTLKDQIKVNKVPKNIPPPKSQRPLMVDLFKLYPKPEDLTKFVLENPLQMMAYNHAIEAQNIEDIKTLLGTLTIKMSQVLDKLAEQSGEKKSNIITMRR